MYAKDRIISQLTVIGELADRQQKQQLWHLEKVIEKAAIINTNNDLFPKQQTTTAMTKVITSKCMETCGVGTVWVI